ncbi:asparagine synthase (glutamine-hydrolyzing) [bacterium]|nr:asparagine synthase (glutamine-hydrolyzing) [bacterium]
MCGICGAISFNGQLNFDAATMIGALQHRGDEEFGAWQNEKVFMGHARLSIIDIATGQQPMSSDNSWITFNGEIFNYIELRSELESLGRFFKTSSDTEVIIQSYLQWGRQCVEKFNGQFAFVIYDIDKNKLFFARDRFGIRPLYYARINGHLIFASEIKSICGFPGFKPELDPSAMAEVMHYWANLAPRTQFSNVEQLPPAHTAVVDIDTGKMQSERYWSPDFCDAAEDSSFVSNKDRNDYAEKARELLSDATTIRLRADVPVGAYLSGGLDSSATSALVLDSGVTSLKTFSVGFENQEFDESKWQQQMADHLGTEHTSVSVGDADIADRFEDIVWHTESVLTRTAPAPLFQLSKLVRDNDYKVVLTGEGADEIFAGYNIFREAKVRAFWARDISSSSRPALLTRLYPYLKKSPPAFLNKFYGNGLDNLADPFFSHRPRWVNSQSLTGLFAEPVTETLEQRLTEQLPERFSSWGTVSKAQYLEMALFLPGYLLSSQGDRMLMGNTVEGRFPFLDHRLSDWLATVPASVKMDSLVEKQLLRKSVADLLPSEIVNREKQPYRAPDSSSFRDIEFPEDDIFDSNKTGMLLKKWQAGKLTSTRDNMAFVAVLSGKILARQFGHELTDRLAETKLSATQITWRS